eukprot:gnl/TRDRNA2_/TRDRNA2_176035_c0_seq10.p1 gnl/TRDRNA2_/TRDRNA2_176035_c0~~gnl/TRDRNA2_/TRDRNA2_176035_c0_seq10.p1  ORF type:complete len:130 (+),score=27.26 gnl/TRDRNA2_/TRDRNA2_176035_c0_seq10:96-485(+)
MGWGGMGKGGWQMVWQPMWGMGKGKGKGKGKDDRAKLLEFPAEQKVWVGGLPATATFKTLQEHMQQAGSVKWVNCHNGQGGIAFATAAEAQYAIAALNGSVYEGAAIQVDVWTEKPKTGKSKGKGKWKW